MFVAITHKLKINPFKIDVILNCVVCHSPTRTLLIAHRVGQRPHESFYPGSTSKQKLIKPYKNLIVYELFKGWISPSLNC